MKIIVSLAKTIAKVLILVGTFVLLDLVISLIP